MGAQEEVLHAYPASAQPPDPQQEQDLLERQRIEEEMRAQAQAIRELQSWEHQERSAVAQMQEQQRQTLLARAEEHDDALNASRQLAEKLEFELATLRSEHSAAQERGNAQSELETLQFKLAESEAQCEELRQLAAQFQQERDD